MSKESKEIKKEKPKPNAHDKYKGTKEGGVRAVLVDENGKETKLNL